MNAFFQIFGIDRKRVATYEHSVDKLKGGKGYIDLFYPGTLIIEQKSLGRDLLGARLQAMDYTHGLSDAEMPKYVLTCDFRTWELSSLETGDQTAFIRHLDERTKNIHCLLCWAKICVTRSFGRLEWYR